MTRESDAVAELARLKADKAGVGRKIFALDPGTSATGVAILEDGEPILMDVLRAKGRRAEDRLESMCQQVADAVHRAVTYHQVDTIALEWQAIRPSDKRPNDILHLAIVLGGALATARGPTLLKPLPGKWKGQSSPEVFDRRVRACFPHCSDLMHRIPGHLQHNAVDALGLAAWAINKRLPWQ